MNYDSANRRTGLLGITECPRKIAGRVGVIAREIHAELERLNHGGDNAMIRSSDCRRNRTRAFKAILSQRYQQQSRCC